MITAHSGCDGTPDNSLEYIRHALTLAVDAFEVDVRRNGASELILSHDRTMQEAVRLEEAFLLLKAYPKKKINCDFKQHGLEADTVRLAMACGVEKQLIFTGSVNAALFQKGKNAYPDVAWYANTECFPEYDEKLKNSVSEAEIKENLRGLLRHMADYETAGLNWNYKKAEIIWQEARSAGIGISVWTVDDPAVQQKWFLRGADNITTRRPVQLLNVRAEMTMN